MKRFLHLLFFLGGISLTYGLQVPIPSDLEKTFDRYSRAWVHEEWGAIFDCLPPTVQKTYLEMFKTRDGYIKNQEAGFKDKIISFERKATYVMGPKIYTFATVVKGKHPSGEEFTSASFTSFELIENRWCMVDPVVPNFGQNLPPPPKP